MSEWRKERIDFCVKTYAGGTPNRSRDDFFDGDIPWISSGEVNQSYIDKTKENITQIGLDGSSAKWIPKGAVLMAMYGATAGQVAKLKIRATANQAVLALIPNEEIIDKDFLYHLLNIEKDKILFFAQGSGQPNLSKGLIDRYYISYPKSTDKQKKIAIVLDTCDTVIEQTQSAIAKYKAIKQGMLHDLFTRGLDTNGKLRPTYQQAPELYKNSELGMIPKEWEVKRLDTLVENFDGKRRPVKQEDRDYMDKIFPYYGASGIIDYVDDYLFDEELILLGEDGENVLSRNVPLAFNVKGKIWVNNHAHVLKPFSFMNIEYLTAALELIDYTPIVSGSAQPKITQKELNKLLVKRPLKSEQIQIAQLISASNKKLQAELTLLSKYQSIKRGLMGDLLSGKKEV